MFSDFSNFSVKEIAIGVLLAVVLIATPFVITPLLVLSVSYSVVPSGDADDSQAEQQLRALLADYDERNRNLILTEAESPDDRRSRHIEITFSNLSNGQAAVLDRQPALTVSINYKHNGCNSRTVTQYSEPVLFNHALAGVQSYLTHISDRTFQSPDSKDATNNLLDGEHARRTNIDNLGNRALTQNVNLGLNYSRTNLPFAEWGQYARDVARYNTTVDEYGVNITELSCMLNTNVSSFATYDDIETRPATIRHSLINSSRASGNQQNAISNAFRMYQEANPGLQFQSVLDSSGSTDLRLQFGTLSNQQTSARVNSDRFTIGADYRGCDARQYGYSQNALTNHALDAIAGYIDEHIPADVANFITPAKLSTANNLLDGERALRQSISSNGASVREEDSYLRQFLYDDRIPYNSWDTYQIRLRSRNTAAENYNLDVRELNCMLDRTAISTTYSEVEAKRREGQYNYAVASMIGYDGYFDRIARNAADEWERYNPTLDFTHVSTSSDELDFYIEYLDIPNKSVNYVGLYCVSKCRRDRENYRQVTTFPAVNYAELLVDTNGRSCNSEIVHYTELYLQDVTMHEIGHFFDLGHTLDENHLLYANGNLDDPFLEDPFDNKGFNVPPIPPWDYSRLGIAEAMTELDGLTLYREADGQRIVRFGTLDRARYLHDRIDCLYNRDGSSPSDSGNQTENNIVPNGQSITGSVSGGVKTFHSITISSAGLLTVYSTGNTDVVGTLYDSAGNQIASNDDGGSGNNFRISERLSAGTYRLEIRGYNSSVTGSYSVQAEFSAVGENTQLTNQTEIDYILDITLRSELEPDTPMVIKKWGGDVKIYLNTDYAANSPHIAELTQELDKIISEINALSESTQLYRVANVDESNHIVYLSDRQTFFNISGSQHLEDNWGLATSWWDDYYVIYRGRAWVDIERNTDINCMKHLLREELTQTLGMLNDVYMAGSIFNQDWECTTQYSEFDKRAISFIFNPQIVAGMNESEVRNVYRQIASNLTTAASIPHDHNHTLITLAQG